ncbi:MAG: ABC transporter permease [Lachnospiraceae bacterium]|nr:ABC transporter permease [Lachnospiraceae bacterium]MDD7378967.1 ABC transporter permease [Lachnospiraceae bacterium]MDY4617404.1 ABC transporter permease [Lachnospiraceae bacterium]
MIENIRLSFQGIWSHKMRSFLTMLGIIIGIAAIIAIVSTIKGTNEQIKENLIGSGDNTVTVELYQGDWPYEIGYEGIPEGVPVVSEEAVEEMQELENVERVSKFYKRQEYDNIYYQNTTLGGGYLYGIEQDYFASCNYQIQEGRGFDDKDYQGQRKVAILDRDSEEALFQGEKAVGKTIEIKGEPYTVVGIVAKSKEFEPVINSMEDYYTYAESSSGAVYVPKATWPIIYQYDEPESILLKVKSTDDMTAAGKGSADILNNYLSVSDETIKYKAEDLLEQAKEIQELSQSTNMMLIWIAGISLLVGGIGVMNIMLVSVTERTSEIGLKKAIGARKGVILGQFLTEAAVLTSLGGLIGVVVGIILAEVISKVSQTPVAISIPAAVGAVLFSMLIGIIFGMLPSYKAANLNPIEALRHE